MLRTPPAAARRQPSPLILAGSSAEDGDISLATTLPSPPLGHGGSGSRPGSSNGAVFLERPSQLRRSSSHRSPSSGSSSPGLGIGGGPLGQAGSRARRRKSTLTRLNEMPTTLLPVDFLARLKDWIETVVIVNFDLDRGPDFDNCYPSMAFSPQERHAIAFSSFPDHNERDDSSLTFSWRLPRLQEDGSTPTGSYLYGYCYFCQQKNPSIRRGYAQRSLAIITKHSRLAGLFTKLVNLLGETYFRDRGGGSPAVETAMYNICRWPAPAPGTVELAFLNHILSVEIPLSHQAQYRLPRSSSHLALNIPPPLPASIPVLASLPATPLSELLRELISQLWLIWELMILGEPVLVYSTDARRASELVQWLVTIVRPLPFGGDWRPFFHIHTPDFARVLNNNKPQAGVILGATNPLILSAARHYPHILRISPATRSDEPVQGVFGTLARSTATGSSFKDAQASAHGVFSERKRHVKKDTVVLKLAEERVRAGNFAAADSLLLQCFSTLTERFLVPLNRYFSTLLPADTHDGMSTPQQTRHFNPANFMHSLKTHGTPLTFRRGKMPSMHVHSTGSDASATSSAVAFYEAFLRSPNFLAWLRNRSETLQSTARSRYLHRLETANPETYLQGKTDADVSDLISRLESEARITEEELQKTPTLMSRQRSASYDVNMLSTSAEARHSAELKNRSQRLRSQVERVKALRQAGLDSSEDSDASSIGGKSSLGGH